MKGFTLIETLIVVSVTMLLAVGLLPVYSNLTSSAQLNDNTPRIIQALRQAQNQSLNRIANTAHGVKFLSSAYVVYQGSDYNHRDSSLDQTYNLDSGLSLVATLNSNDVNFALGNGTPNNIGSITLTQVTLGHRTITINSIGAIDQQ